MECADSETASGQRHIERLGGKRAPEFRVGKRSAPRIQRCFEFRLGVVDCRTDSGALSGRQFGKRFQLLGQRARLTEIAGLGVLKRRGIVALREVRERGCHDAVELIRLHTTSIPEKKGGGFAPPFFVRSLDQVKEAFACSAIFVNAALSWTARSASTLRSMSIAAFFNPLMNVLYDSPSSRTAALIRAIHSTRNSRLRWRRSRYWYCPAFMTACFAIL